MSCPFLTALPPPSPLPSPQALQQSLPLHGVSHLSRLGLYTQACPHLPHYLEELVGSCPALEQLMLVAGWGPVNRRAQAMAGGARLLRLMLAQVTGLAGVQSMEVWMEMWTEV